MPTVERRAHFVQYRSQVLELFARRGFSQVGMRELAASLGLSAGSLYHHYPSKQDLLFDLIEELFEALNSVVRSVGRKAQKKKEKLPVLIQAHLALHVQMPWHFCLAERDLGCLTDEQQQQVKMLREHYERSVYSMLCTHADDSDVDAPAIARLIAHLLNSTPAWLANSALDQHARNDLLQDLLHVAIGKLLEPSHSLGVLPQRGTSKNILPAT